MPNPNGSGEQSIIIIRNQKPYSTNQPKQWCGVSSIEGEYAYAIFDDPIEDVSDYLGEFYEKESDCLLGDISDQFISLPSHYLALLQLKGIKKTYVVSQPDEKELLPLMEDLTQTYECCGFFYLVSSKNHNLLFYHFDEDGYCDEKLEYGIDGSNQIHFQSELREIEFSLIPENIFDIINDCFEYHEICDLMLNFDSLISGPDESGLYSATLKRMPDLKCEIDILDLD